MRTAWAAAALASLLAGCGYYDTQAARDPLGRHGLVGLSVPDLLNCAGRPDAVAQTGPDTAILQYDHKDESTGLKATLTLLGSIELGGGGGCSAVFTVLRDGTVADVTFPRSYADGLFTTPYSACEPLISECLAHPGRTALPAGYEAFTYILPEKHS